MEIGISALIFIGILSSLSFISHDIAGFAFGKMTTLISIHGDGFGNDGSRFKSFVDCSNQQHQIFDGGSHTNFSVDLSNKTLSKNKIGTWIIEYKTAELSHHNLLSKGGYFTNEKMNGSHYSLTGLETIDSVCERAPTSIMLTGECGENKPITYIFANGEKTGSTTPPFGGQVYYLFGSNVQCTTVDSNNNK
jgi:hypothetical protein